jgi:hypothetical protein
VLTTTQPRCNQETIDHYELVAASVLAGERAELALTTTATPTARTATQTKMDKLSSPSSSSYNSSGVQTPNSRRGGNGEPYLAIRRQPPSHVFPKESFEIEIGLEHPKIMSPSASRGGQGIELVATLHDLESGGPAGPEASLVTEPQVIILPILGGASKRQCQVTCTVSAGSISREKGAAYVIQLGPKPGTDQSKALVSVSTNPIHIVNYKTKISMEEDWGHVWYKDEGGRDKCMEVFAGIYDRNDRIRTADNIPLHVSLCYDTDDGGESVRVTNQDILRTIGTSKMQIEKGAGKTRIRFRVEDVSKNHQGQDFKLEVGPDPKAKGFKDVAPGYTPAVSVRSKRNKRARHTSSALRPGIAAGDRRSTSPVGGLDRRARSGYDDYGAPPRDGPFDGIDIAHLREAMKGVIDWTDEVVNGLYPLQWQIMGYAQNPDGSPDYSRPYHNMPNPNACISRILSIYSDVTRENLRVLLNAVEQVSPERPDESPYAAAAGGGMAPSIPRDTDDRAYGMMGRGPIPVHGQPGLPPHQSVGRHPGLHPSVASEAFREKLPDAPMHYHSPPGAMLLRHQQAPFLRPRPPPHPMMDDPDGMQMHSGPPLPPARAQMHPRMGEEKQAPMPVQRSTLHGFVHQQQAQEEESRESEVEYVLAKQFKALRTGERLGFPAYSVNREILGFYHESSTKVGVGQFTPIGRHRSDFGPLEIMQATDILDDAIAKKSEAVHALKDWGSIATLIDHALVYDWSKDIGNDPSASGSTD